VGDLFAGALVPGFIMVGLYLLWIIYKAIFQPTEVPAMKMTAEEQAGLSWRVISALLPPLFLVLAVLGSILFGFATPSESASVGAIGAMILAAMNGRMSFATLRYASMNTMMTTAVIFVIVIAASLFSLVFRGLGGEHMVEEALKNVPGGVTGALFVVMFIMFILGFFLDTFEIILIMLPVCGPALLAMGVDPVWLGILIGVNLQTSFLTPPFGFTLFYMRSIAPPSITTSEIWLGSISWTWLQMFALGIIWAFPGTATWLPKYLFASPTPAAIHGPATAGEKPGTSPSRSLDSILGTTKFDKDGMPIEEDNPFAPKR
jgi:tripartite ATP-independent transporter DctM subunit